MSEFMKYALAYAKRLGWAVFPIAPRGKRPISEHGFNDATTDERQIWEWWTRTPDANVGFNPLRSGAVAIDLDGEAGIEHWNFLVASTQMPYTRAAASISGSGQGRHLIYRLPEGVTVPQSNGVLGEHIEVAAHRLTLPPSVHASGGVYEWIEGAHPRDGYDEFPACLLELLREKAPVMDPSDYKPPRNWTSAIQKAYEEVANAVPKTRNQTLYRKAFYLSHLETETGDRIAMEDVRGAMLLAAQACGLKEAEALATIQSGIRGKR